VSLDLEHIPAPTRRVDPDPEHGAHGAAALPDLNQSAVDRLRAERARMDNGTEVFDLPGYENLKMRVRRLTPDDITAVRKRGKTETEMNELLLVEACEEIVVSIDGQLEPLAAPGTPPVRFDARFAEALGQPVDAPASLIGPMVLRLAMTGSGAEPNRIAINELGTVVYVWMVLGSHKDDEPGKA
jgi:hypothetical protein